jgi:plasmid stability protein
VDTTIRNLDAKAYRALRARARVLGKTVGAAVSEAMRAYVARPGGVPGRGSLRDLEPQAYPRGNERLSEEIDMIVYGA